MLGSAVSTQRAAQSTAYESVAVVSEARSVVVSSGKQSISTLAEFASPNYASVLGLKPESASFGADPRGVALSPRLAQRLFATSPVRGQALRVNGQTFQVVGLLPNRFRGIGWLHTDVLLPIESARTLLGSKYLDDPNTQWLTGVVRLKPSATPEMERRELNRISQQLRTDYPKAHEGLELTSIPLREHYFSHDLQRGGLYVLMAACALLLLCYANLGNLVLATSIGRVAEISMYRALGASPIAIYYSSAWPLVVVTTASLSLASIAARPATVTLVDLSEIPPASAKVDPLAPPVLLGVVAIAVFLTLLLGLIPISMARSKRLSANLTQSKGPGRGGRRLRSALIVLEVAMALVLCLGAGVLLRSLGAISSLDVGFDTSRLSAIRLQLVGEQYEEPGAKARFAEEFTDRLESSGSFEMASFGGRRLAPDALFGATALRESDLDDREGVLVFRHSVAPGYLETFDIPLLEGRLLDDTDRLDRVPVAVVSASTAESLWPGESALGKRFRLEPEVNDDPQWTVVGVVDDIEARGPRSPYENRDIYFPFEQLEEGDFYVVMRSQTGLGAQEREIHQLLRELDSSIPLNPVESMRKRFSNRAADERFATVITSIFSGLALILAAVGIFGVMNLSVTQRVQELGVRLALGAKPRAILGEVVLRATTLAAIGIGAGLVISFFLRKLLSGFLYGVGPFDPIATAGAVTTLFAVAILASLLPARRAMRVDPVVAIKNQ